jgi:hypothetical protein
MQLSSRNSKQLQLVHHATGSAHTCAMQPNASVAYIDSHTLLCAQLYLTTPLC